MTASFSRLQTLVRDFHSHAPSSPVNARKAVVILVHGLGGDRNDWMNPFQERNWPYEHERKPEEQAMGVHGGPPIAKMPGLDTKYFFSPRFASNALGADGSDDRSWWNALAVAGFTLFTYSEVAGLLMPLNQGPVAEFKRFMEALQKDVLSDSAYAARPVVILAHSRGGLISRAYLSDPEVKGDSAGRFPAVRGLITLSTPHQGSSMGLLDDRVIDFLNKVDKAVPNLPNDFGDKLIETLKAKVDAYVGATGDELEPDSPFFRAVAAQEPPKPGIRFISVGGTSSRFLRVYFWTFSPDSLLPRKGDDGKMAFHWKAVPIEAKGASPFPDGLPLKVLGLDLDEIIPGRGDGLVAEKRSHFPPAFKTEEHLPVALSHAEELWNPTLQAEIIKRLNTFA
jgi:pimeloyl-ACP methyl ester carboxylesterase